MMRLYDILLVIGGTLVIMGAFYVFKQFCVGTLVR